MKISKNAVIRLSQYKNVIYYLQSMGMKKVFSDNLADAVGVTASQVRRDFGIFGISGKRRGGYSIEELTNRLNVLLGKDKLQKVIVVGLGNVGRALVGYNGFTKDGIEISAGFDTDASKCKRQKGFTVFPIDKLQAFAKENNIKVGIICVPEQSAQSIADLMMDTPIKGILNFAPVRLKVKKDCLVHNVNLGMELEAVIYFVNCKDKGTLDEGN